MSKLYGRESKYSFIDELTTVGDMLFLYALEGINIFYGSRPWYAIDYQREISFNAALYSAAKEPSTPNYYLEYVKKQFMLWLSENVTNDTEGE